MKTHPSDPRTKIADDIPELLSLGKDFRGAALCPYDPFTPEQEREIAAFADRSLDELRVEYDDAAIEAGRRDGSIPKVVLDTVDKMAEIFEGVAGQKVRSRFLRINSHLKQGFHTHDTSLTYAFTEGGSLALNEQGEVYSAPKRNIFVFDSSIAHDSSKFGSLFDPKLSIVIF